MQARHTTTKRNARRHGLLGLLLLSRRFLEFLFQLLHSQANSFVLLTVLALRFGCLRPLHLKLPGKLSIERAKLVRFTRTLFEGGKQLVQRRLALVASIAVAVLQRSCKGAELVPDGRFPLQVAPPILRDG